MQQFKAMQTSSIHSKIKH